MSTPQEKQIINKLIKEGGDESKLNAAACYLIKCYALYAIGSEKYEQNLALAKEGEQYTAEQSKLKETTVTVEYTVEPDYWSRASKTETREVGGFDYNQASQIEDGKQASDEFRINYIAKTLGVDPGTVRLTEDGFKLVGQAGAIYYGGKLTQTGGLLAEETLGVNKSPTVAEKGTSAQVDKTLPNGNLPVVREGKVTYEPLAKPNKDEIRAGNKFSELGYDVTFKKESTQLNVRTQDLWVDGIGKVDVYTPKITDQTKIIRAIEKKDTQTTSVLTQIDLSGKEMQQMANRVWGKSSVKNINTLFFQDSKGQIHRFDRPVKGK